MLASSRKPCGGANPRRRAKTPALQSRREWAATHKRRPSARPAGGPGASPEGYSQGKVPHPSVAWGDTSPCRGGFIGGSPPKASPARGGGCAARRRRRGALPVCGGNILQGSAGPCPASVGDDACIVPETLRCRKTPGGGRNRPPYIAAINRCQPANASHPPGPPAGRCKHRPLRRGAASAGRAAACRSQSRRPYALHCRAGVHARRGGLGRGDAVVLRKRRTARPGRSEAARKGIGKGWEPAPTGPAADKPSAVTPAGSKFRW